MKKQIALLLLLSMLLAGCNTASHTAESTDATTPTTAATEPSTTPSEPSTVPTGPSTAPTKPTTAPTEPTATPTEPTTTPAEPDEAKIRAITDPAVMEHYHLTDLDDYRVYVTSYGNGKIYARYTLCIGGYGTWEDYTVTLSPEYQIIEIDGDYGEYAQYLPYVTPEMIEAAEANLAQQSAAYTEEGAVSMSIDEEGYLILRMEIIHEYEPITPGTGGCSIDHDHLFFTARICPEP